MSIFISPDNWNAYFARLFQSLGLSDDIALFLNAVANAIIILFIAYVFNTILRLFIIKFIGKIAQRTDGKFDDLLIKNRAFRNVASLLTLFLLTITLPYALYSFPEFNAILSKFLEATAVILILLIIKSFLHTAKDYLQSLDSFRDKPLESYVQIFMMFTWIMGIILVFSIFTGKSVWQFLTAMGALSAVLLLLFKDTILGFVSTIQVSVNDTVRLGDWITMSKHGADGTVTEINLTSVKVRNFDNTISTIPTYYLTSEAFQNWRGMSESDGRRILRSINIKMDSVRFLNEEDISRFSQIQLISDYIKKTEKANIYYNREANIDTTLLVNGKNQTNLGLFRMYINEYLSKIDKINKQMTYICRQQEPTPHGIPLQIFAFSVDKSLVEYESVQAELFDHLIAAVKYFDLQIFEMPTGNLSKITVKNKYLPGLDKTPSET